MHNAPTAAVDPRGESATAGVLGGLASDVALPEPSDAAWPKWVGWALALTGAVIYDLCTEREAEREERCQENLDRDMATCRKGSRRYGSDWFRVCEQQAMSRYSNCLSGRDDGIDARLPPWGKL